MYLTKGCFTPISNPANSGRKSEKQKIKSLYFNLTQTTVFLLRFRANASLEIYVFQMQLDIFLSLSFFFSPDPPSPGFCFILFGGNFVKLNCLFLLDVFLTWLVFSFLVLYRRKNGTLTWKKHTFFKLCILMKSTHVNLYHCTWMKYDNFALFSLSLSSPFPLTRFKKKYPVTWKLVWVNSNI